MPRLPKWMNDAVEGILASKFRNVSVTNIEYFSPQLKKVGFQGDFSGLSYRCGYAVAFRVTELDYRNYTPYNFDTVKGTCDMLFHLHGNGPGSDWAQRLLPGEQLKMAIPRGKAMYAQKFLHHFFVGDETSIGFCLALKQEAERHAHSFNGVLELGKEHFTTMDKLGLGGYFSDKMTSQRFNQIKNLVDKPILSDRISPDSIAFYITGNAATLRSVRKELRFIGIPGGNVFSQAYWMNGKCGL